MTEGTSRPRSLQEVAEGMAGSIAKLRHAVLVARAVLRPETCEHCAAAWHVLNEVDD